MVSPIEQIVRDDERAGSGQAVDGSAVRCGCGESLDARRDLRIAAGKLASERSRRARAEHVLHEQLGQELAGISFMVGALTGQRAMLDGDRDALLGRIADLLSVAIERCQCMTGGLEPGPVLEG